MRIARTLIIVVSVILMFLLGSVVFGQTEDYVVAFLLADSPSDNGWNAAHYRGIERLKELGEVVEESGLGFSVRLASGQILRVVVIDGVGYSDSDIERVARSAIDQGANYVWGTWWDSQGAMSRLAEEFPNVLFEHGSGYPFVQSNGRNFSTYFVRIEEGDYLVGLAAGMLELCQVGLVGTYPIPEPVRQVNAFALGLRDAGCAEVEVRVVWNMSWLDRELEVQATEALIAEGYTTIRQLADTPYTSQTTCQHGDAYTALGLGTDVTPYARCALVTNAWGWGEHYLERVGQALDGTWTSIDWWGGIAEGGVVMIWNDALLTAEMRDYMQVEVLADMIGTGEFDPFCGPIHGTGMGGVEVVVPEGMCLSDMDLLTMQWFVDGVVSDYPSELPADFELELMSIEDLPRPAVLSSD